MPSRSTQAPSYTFSVPGFTRAVKVLIIATTAVYVLQFLVPSLNTFLIDYFALVPSLVVRGQIWRLASYLFLHASWSHLFWNMFALWMFGVWAEEGLGSRRLYQLYFVSGIGGGLIDSLVHLWLRPGTLSITIGASGAIYGILLAVGMMYPDRPVFLLLPPVTVKVKWLVLFYGAMEFLFTLHAGNDGVAHVAHLGGMLFAFLYMRYMSSNGSRFGLLDSYDRWRRRQMQKRFEVYMNQRDRRNPPGGWTN